MMIVQYLLDADERVVIPGVDAPQTDFADAVAPVALALEQEKRVTEQIVELVKLRARKASSSASSSCTGSCRSSARRSPRCPRCCASSSARATTSMVVEEYLARASGGENPLEAGAPPAAGGAL